MQFNTTSQLQLTSKINTRSEHERASAFTSQAVDGRLQPNGTKRLSIIGHAQGGCCEDYLTSSLQVPEQFRSVEIYQVNLRVYDQGKL